MHKITVIGAGNVGGLAALRIAENELGEVVLMDKFGGIAEAKACDLNDSRAVMKKDFRIIGTGDITAIKDSHIVVITAGLARKPDMTREDLLHKNAAIVQELAQGIRDLAPDSIIVTVTNPLDLMTYLTLKVTGFEPRRIIGMGISLDTSRFINLIAQELNISPLDVDGMVIGSHGEGMLPLPRLTMIKGVPLTKFLDKEKIDLVVKGTWNRGAQIVSLFGTGSAYVAPSAAIADIVKAIIKDEKRVIGAACYLQGEYGISDACLGVPCRIGKKGIEGIVELQLNPEEKNALLKSADLLKKHLEVLKKYW